MRVLFMYSRLLQGSLTGSNTDNSIGRNGITVLTNGNYVIASSNWFNGAGAAMWGNGATASSGKVNAANSLVGSTAFDNIGGFGNSVTALSNGNYVVTSTNWDNGSIVDAGAATWGNGAMETSGIVITINSLTGSASGDFGSTRNEIASISIVRLSNSNYIVPSGIWDNPSLVYAGQVRLVYATS